MTRYLEPEEILVLHEVLIEQSGGSPGLRDWNLLDSAVAQPRMTFAGQDLYPNVVDKAAALGYSLICNHPFVDGNKRVGHLAMEMFLMLNGLEIEASIDEQEQIILSVAAGQMQRDTFTDWLKIHAKARQS
jgi:death-on-curing protein